MRTEKKKLKEFKIKRQSTQRKTKQKTKLAAGRGTMLQLLGCPPHHHHHQVTGPCLPQVTLPGLGPAAKQITSRHIYS